MKARHIFRVAAGDAALTRAHAMFQEGLALHKKGQLAQAQAIYEHILKLQPRHSDSLHLLGVIALQTANPGRAAELIRNATEIDPKNAAAHSNLGNALRDLKQPQAALESYERAIALKPDYTEACYNRGNAFLELQQPEAALESYDQAIALKPNYAIAFNNRGHALQYLKRLRAAIESYDQAILLRPDFGEAYYNRGNALLALNQLQAALKSYDRAIALRPNYPEAHYNRGNALLELQQPQAALESYDRAIALMPDYGAAFNTRGNALRELKQPQAALDSYDKAIALKPDNPDTYYCKGLCMLLLGDFERGWSHYEWRKKRFPAVGSRTYFQPSWLGQEDIKGKTLFVHCEQGLGDTIQFCRYVKLAEARGAKAILSVQNSLLRLLRQLSPTVEIVSSALTPSYFDYHTPLLSMPLAFKTGKNTIPAEIPYLRAEADRIARWKDRISPGGFKIGIAWQGSQEKVDIGRSFPVTSFSAISRLPNVRLISLQKNAGVEQLSDLPPGMKVETLGPDFDAGPDAFIDTAAVMESLDLIITSDTSIAHLAGALGRPTWVALKHVPNWRWQLERTDSPWYSTMMLFRQPSRVDWASVFAAMETKLAGMLGAAEYPSRLLKPLSTPHVPISWGELIDKITILEIKGERLTAKVALANVQRELAALKAVVGATHGRNANLSSLRSHLKTINAVLWEIEDKIRVKEALKSFDQEFIELARAVYVRNDERGRVKRQINDLLSSEFVEEKQYTTYSLRE